MSNTNKQHAALVAKRRALVQAFKESGKFDDEEHKVELSALERKVSAFSDVMNLRQVTKPKAVRKAMENVRLAMA